MLLKRGQEDNKFGGLLYDLKWVKNCRLVKAMSKYVCWCGNIDQIEFYKILFSLTIEIASFRASSAKRCFISFRSILDGSLTSLTVTIPL